MSNEIKPVDKKTIGRKIADRKTVLLALLAVGATGLVSAQVTARATPAAPEHADAYAEGTRLLVSDADSSTVSLLDLASGELLGSFSTPGAGGSAYASPSGQYGLVVHCAENRVSVVDSGLRLEVSGRPSSVAVLALAGGTVH